MGLWLTWCGPTRMHRQRSSRWTSTLPNGYPAATCAHICPRPLRSPRMMLIATILPMSMPAFRKFRGFTTPTEADDLAATRWRRTAESNARPKSSNNIHIRIRQRKDKKSITTVQGLSEHFELKQIIKALKKVHPISRVSVQIIRSRRSETIAARRDVFTGAQHERHGPRGPRGRLRHSDAGTRSIPVDRFQPIPAFGRAGVVE